LEDVLNLDDPFSHFPSAAELEEAALNQYVPIQRLNFTDGELIARHSEIEYRLPDGERIKHYGQRDLQNCFAGKRIHFYGDSRIRGLFASFAEALVGRDHYPEAFPHHRACLGHNQPGEKSAECIKWFTGSGKNAYNAEVAKGGVHASFQWNKYANHHEPLPSERPDILLVNNGAWSAFGRIGHKEFDGNRESFIRSISRDLPNNKTLKLFVSYPNCFANGPVQNKAQVLVSKLLPTLYLNNWTLYDPSVIADPKVWVGLDYAKAWSRDLLPKGMLPKELKWDQCTSVHTWDALADLEMQIIFNNLCREAEPLALKTARIGLDIVSGAVGKMLDTVTR
jgi:hypothetical protein